MSSAQELSSIDTTKGDASGLRGIAEMCDERGGQDGSFPGPWRDGEYAPRSDFIHNTLGWMILAIILAWSCIIMRGTVCARCCGLRGSRGGRRRRQRHSGPGGSSGGGGGGGGGGRGGAAVEGGGGADDGASGSDTESLAGVGPVLCSAYCSAGVLSIAAGVFLFSWVLYFLKPDDVPALHAFVRQDLVSMQHIALSILLFAAGSGEVTFAWMVARAGLEKCRNYRWMHQVWFANMALGGCLFLAHPQKTIELAIQHSVIGTALVFGAHFLACEKLRNFEGCLQWKFPSRLEVPGDLAMATVAFAIAAGTLIGFCDFREDTGHRGVLLACQGATAVVIVALAVGSATLVVLVAAFFFFAAASSSTGPPPRGEKGSAGSSSRRGLGLV